MSQTFNRGTGLVVIEVRASNPNGDPDAEGEPRTIGPDQRGLISPVSFKRKPRAGAWIEARHLCRSGADRALAPPVSQPLR